MIARAARKVCENDVLDGGGGATSWNDLTDRPFYEEGYAITWDGNTEGLTQLPDMGSTYRFYKVSDSVLSKSDLIGAEVVGVNGGESATRIISEQDIEDVNDLGIMLNIQNSIMCVAMDFSDDNSYPPLKLEKGVYFNFDPHGIYVASLKNTSIKTLDEKFLPDSVKGGGSTVVFDCDMNTNAITCERTYEEMLNLVQNNTWVNCLFRNISDGKVASTGIIPTYSIADETANLGFEGIVFMLFNGQFVYKTDGTLEMFSI